LLPMNSANRPRTIHARNDMVSPSCLLLGSRRQDGE
jgi:hypothetical protein